MSASLCLDLTRLTRRAGVPQFTGVDRVERAYLDHVLADSDIEAFGLVRVGQRFCLLDRAALDAFAKHVDGVSDWRAAGLRRLISARSPEVLGAERTVSGLALLSAHAGLAGDEMRAVLPGGVVYLNVGHSNLKPDVFGAILSVPNSQAVILLHDTIPIDFPQFQRPGTIERFKEKLRTALKFGNRIVVPSQVVADRLAQLANGWGFAPEIVVAPLGIQVPEPGLSAAKPQAKAPYFVCIGTIEPRKNHAILLDTWEAIDAGERPELYFVGRRGWLNKEVFARLDRGIEGVHEVHDMNDAKLAQLLSGAAGLLFPSHAEGFGLPPHEAASIGVPPVCAPLEVYRETLGDVPIYADANDLYQWRDAVMQLAKRHNRRARPSDNSSLEGYVPPTWQAHFKMALTPVC